MKDRVIACIERFTNPLITPIKLDVPLGDQYEIDSLDCAEIELDIEDEFGIKLQIFYDIGTTVTVNSTPQEIIDKVEKLVDQKKKKEEADKQAQRKIVNRVRLF